MVKKLRGLAPLLVIVIGLLVLFYPTISNFLVMKNASRVVSNYDAAVEALSDEEYRSMIVAAHAYNTRLAEESSGITSALTGAVNTEATDAEYMKLLNLAGDGMMGYITVPKLEETLPIYHGTSEKVLQSGIGHLEQTSLPVGGASTHAALSGHRGLPTAKLFTDLNLMKKATSSTSQYLKTRMRIRSIRSLPFCRPIPNNWQLSPARIWSRSSLVRRMRSIRIGCWCVAIASHTRRSSRMTPNPRSTWTFRCSTCCRLLH